MNLTIIFILAIPAAVLNVPFFDTDRPFSMNYGAIGAIIGHEFTHGFDNLGRRFDLNGQETNWWTNATLTEFNHKTACFIKQYSAILDPVANLHVSVNTVYTFELMINRFL